MEAGAVPRVAPPKVPALTPRLLRLASDARLVGLVRERRSGAFEAVYDRHHRGILAFCRHMLSDADEAEDAVQHTFMAAYSDLLASEKPIHLRAWLYTIARNRCYSILRGRREQPSADLEETEGEGLASQVQRRQDLRDLVHDLRQLPQEQRAALVLAELDALPHSEIAEVLSVRPEKVKALVFQARESLAASRAARDTACSDIREQIACGRGASLRRANLRRHLRECDGCREFRAQVEHQRKQFALLLPVVPTLALKQTIFGTVGLGGGAAAVGGGVIAGSALKGGIAKGLVGAVLAGVGTAGTIVATTTDLHVQSILNSISGSLSHGFPAGRHAAVRADRDATRSRAAAVTATGSTVGLTALLSTDPGSVLTAGASQLAWGGSSTPLRGHHRLTRSDPGAWRGMHRVSAAPPTRPAAPATAPASPPVPAAAAPVTVHGYGSGVSSSAGNQRGSGAGASGRGASQGNSGQGNGHDRTGASASVNGSSSGGPSSSGSGTDSAPGNSGSAGAGSRGDSGGNGNGNGKGSSGSGSGSAGGSGGSVRGQGGGSSGSGGDGGSGSGSAAGGASGGTSGSSSSSPSSSGSGNGNGNSGGNGNGNSGGNGNGKGNGDGPGRTLANGAPGS